MKCNRRAGHSRVASLAALPHHLLPHPAGCKFIGNINLVGEAIGLPHYGLWMRGRPLVALRLPRLQVIYKRRGEGHPALQYNVIFTFILNSPFSILHYVNRKINLLNHWAFLSYNEI